MGSCNNHNCIIQKAKPYERYRIVDEYISQLSWGRWQSFQFFLGDGNGLEAVQLLEQAAPLGGVQAVDEVARALRRVQRLDGLLLGVGAQPPGASGGRERQQPPPAAAPGRRAGRGGGCRARPQAARGPAPQQRQQPGHGGLRSGDPRGSPGGRLLTRLGREQGAGSARPRPEVLLTGSRGAGHHALRGPARRSPPFPSPRSFQKASDGSGLSEEKNFLRGGRARRAPGEGGRVVRAGASRLRRSGAGGLG